MKTNIIIKILEYIVYIIVVIFALLAISSKFSIGGFELLVVKSGSMEPAIKTGSIVIDKNFDSYNIGDIITFRNKEKPKETTTHRIAGIKYLVGTKSFVTKGDANDSTDSEQASESQIVGRVLLAIPYFGYVADFARSLPGLIIIILIPATIIVYEEMKKIHKETKQIIHKRRKRKEEAKNKKDELAKINIEQELK